MSLSLWWRQARHIRSLTIRLAAKGEELYAAHQRILALSEGRSDDADLRAADARIAALTEQLAEAARANRAATDRATGLERQLAEYAAKNVATHRLVDQHAQVSALPPALNRDRANAHRLAAENDRLRARVDELEAKYERNPS